MRRTPQGVRGLKQCTATGASGFSHCRTPQGVRGLKLHPPLLSHPRRMSHSARSAWIETTVIYPTGAVETSRTPQGVRGLKLLFYCCGGFTPLSHSARSAWIETRLYTRPESGGRVALRKECVD